MQKIGTRILIGLLIGIPLLALAILMNVLMLDMNMAMPMLISKNLLVLMMLAAYGYYVLQYHAKLAINKLLFVIVTTTLMIILCLMLIGSNFLMMPMLIAVMLISMVIERRLAIITHTMSVLMVGIIGEMTLAFYIFYLVTGIVSSLLIIYAKERTRIVFIAAIISVYNMVVYGLTLTVLDDSFEIIQLLFAGLNGALTIIIVTGSLPLWEAIFQVVTPLKLLEYVNTEHKLQQRLLTEAPGTFHHSRMVSSLAERAAQHIGANALLCRAGALYHDIGKLKEPFYFIENQDGRDNPHDEIAADASASIIIEHVEYGVKLAKEHKLPRAIIDIIEQHHGTSLVGYFYHKAKSYNDGVKYDESLFRYDGPKPQSNEAAIVMLADCVEAYVRSLGESERDLSRIKKIIGEVIAGKLNDHQLEDSNLKIKELPRIAEAFIQVYNGMYHDRVKYPTNK